LGKEKITRTAFLHPKNLCHRYLLLSVAPRLAGSRSDELGADNSDLKEKSCEFFPNSISAL